MSCCLSYNPLNSRGDFLCQTKKWLQPKNTKHQGSGIKNDGLSRILPTQGALVRKRSLLLTGTGRPMTCGRKEGEQQIDTIKIEHCSQIERRAGQGQCWPRCFRHRLQRAPEHAGCRWSGSQRAAWTSARVFHGARPLLPRAEHPAPPRIRSALSGNGQSERKK